MHIFTACLNHETNTFSPMPTTLKKFSECVLSNNAKRGKNIPYYQAPLAIFEQCAEDKGWQYTESLTACAWPCGLIIRSVYEGFRDEILKDLKKAMPVDIVLLNLHGAMIADGYDDCEGDLLEHIRKIVGPDCIIGIELDPHTHLSDKMTSSCDLIVAMKEYPHTDFKECAEQLCHLAALTAEKKIKPAMSIFDCKMLNMFPTTIEPMQSYVAKLRELEASGQVLSASVIHGFPWGDTPYVGTKIITIANDKETADNYAKELGLELLEIREKTLPPLSSIDGALDEALQIKEGPVILTDFSDNPGGGAFGDSTFILQRVIDRNITNVALSPLWDPICVEMAISAGVGATLDLRIGGKMGVTSGDPVDLTVTVKHIEKDFIANFCDQPIKYGDCVCVSSNGVDIVLNTINMQTFATECFTAFGIDINKKHILIVKSSAHFRKAFEPIASKIITVSTPGSLCLDFAKIPYKKAPKDLWPLVNAHQPTLL